MQFLRTPLKNVWLIEPEKKADMRGFFARTFCAEEFSRAGIHFNIKQMNVSFSRQKGTLRGMHYQLAPFAEIKVIRCTRGRIYDVALDIRPESPTFRQSFGAELSWEDHRMLYLPHGCAHGFISLEEDTEIVYLVSEYYSPEHERGIRYNDPFFAIEWPMPPSVISAKDASWSDYRPAQRVGGMV